MNLNSLTQKQEQLIKENEKLKIQNLKYYYTNKNIKRSKLRLKKKLNNIIAKKQSEIVQLNKNHFNEMTSSIDEYEKKIKELENIINCNTQWEWVNIEELN